MSTLVPPPVSSPHSVLEQREIQKTRYATYSQAAGLRHFWFRRVHSLMGLAFGGYITVHLLVNATGFWPKTYQQNVDKIHSLEPNLWLIEIATIFVPLLIHALYGAYISTVKLDYNPIQYNYGGNVRYTLQRWGGLFLLLFVAYHIATLHKWGLGVFGVEGYPKFQGHNMAYQSTVQALKAPYESAMLNVGVAALYLLGIWAAVFHWANGLWTSAIAWGLTITAKSQQRWGNVCLGFGIVMFIVGTAAWVAFTIIGNPSLPMTETMTHL